MSIILVPQLLVNPQDSKLMNFSAIQEAYAKETPVTSFFGPYPNYPFKPFEFIPNTTSYYHCPTIFSICDVPRTVGDIVDRKVIDSQFTLSKVGTGCSNPLKPLNPATGSCESSTDNPKNSPTSCPSSPNPVTAANGNKHFDFTDVAVEGASPLSFIRHYNSSPVYYYTNIFDTAGLTRNPIGLYWYHNYHQGLTVTQDIQSSPLVKLILNTGQTFSYHPPVSGNIWTSDADVNYRLEEVKDSGIRTGWKVITPDDTVETYSTIGDLLTITNRAGIKQTLAYSTAPTVTAPFPGLLSTVTDSFGRQLNFTYDQRGQLTKVALSLASTPTVEIYTVNYAYDNGNLKTVIYPDDTPINNRQPQADLPLWRRSWRGRQCIRNTRYRR